MTHRVDRLDWPVVSGLVWVELNAVLNRPQQALDL